MRALQDLTTPSLRPLFAPAEMDRIRDTIADLCPMACDNPQLEFTTQTVGGDATPPCHPQTLFFFPVFFCRYLEMCAGHDNVSSRDHAVAGHEQGHSDGHSKTAPAGGVHAEDGVPSLPPARRRSGRRRRPYLAPGSVGGTHRSVPVLHDMLRQGLHQVRHHRRRGPRTGRQRVHVLWRLLLGVFPHAGNNPIVRTCTMRISG